MTEKCLSTTLTPELLCTSLKDSLAFYTELLGFSVQYRSREGGFAMIERNGSFIMLDEIAPGSTDNWIVATLETPFGRGINLRIETKEVDVLYARVKEADAKIFLPIEDKWYRGTDVDRGNRQFIVQDPDGYLLRFFQDLGQRKRMD